MTFAASAQPQSDVKTTYAKVMSMGEAQTTSADADVTTPTRLHYLGVQLFSIIPSLGIESFRGTSGTGAFITGVGGLVGPAYSDEDQHFGVKISPELKSGKFIASVEVTPWKSAGNLITGRTFSVDLTDMKTTSIELAKKADGRVYLLSLTPSVDVQKEKPAKSIAKSGELLEDFYFNNSAVILESDRFLGTMTGSGGNLAYIDIPGYFTVEYSLVHFKGSVLAGELNDGVIRMTNEKGQMLEIYNVSCAVGEPLPNGPYQVWARWSPPKYTFEEARDRELKALEQAKKDGIPINVPERLVNQVKAGKPFMMGHGMTSVSKDERL